MNIETIWQPVEPHDGEPVAVATTHARTVIKTRPPAPAADESLAWLRKNPGSSATQMAQAMSLSANTSTSRLRLLVSRGDATEAYTPSNIALNLPRFFYTAVPEVADGH